MIRIGIIVFALALVSLSWHSTSSVKPSAEDQKGIVFQDITFEAALKQAKASNKLIFLDAYAVWCGPCKWMDAQTFKDEKVGAFYNEHFINLKKDMEKGEGPALAKRFKVTAYPTMFFINGDGEVIHKILGAKPAKEFLQEAQKVVS